MPKIRLEDLTADHLRNCGAIFADAGDGAILVKPDKRLPPFMSRDTEAPVSPEQLVVLVPEGTEDPVAAVLLRSEKVLGPEEP